MMGTSRVSQQGLLWGIKDSFCSYVLGQADGGCDLRGVEYLKSGEFFFPLAEKTDELPHAWQFSGAAEFSAHGGVLRVSIVEPQLIRMNQDHVDESKWQWGLTVGDGTLGRITLAHLYGDADSPKGDRVVLSKDGSAVFGGHYMPGEELDPLLVLS